MLNEIPTVNIIPNGSLVSLAIFIPLWNIIIKIVITEKAPQRPNSSPIIAKIKSVCGVGKKRFFSRLFPSPKPPIPPLPRLIRDCWA